MAPWSLQAPVIDELPKVCLDPRMSRAKVDLDGVDVVVIGGGPAGSTAANILAQAGWRVRLFERERFPRYHIGESLQAGTHFLWDALGVRERLANAGFVVKKGATYRWGQNEAPWSVTFAEEGSFPTAYQVDRGKFDQIMLERAAEVGVEVREEHTVLGPIVEDGRCVGVRVIGPDEVEHEVRARYVVDASGQARCLDKLLPPTTLNKKLGRAAIWTYFEGVSFLPEVDHGNIFISTMPEGWCWFIPLAGDRTSVGCVIGSEFKGRSAHGSGDGEPADLQQLFDSLLATCKPIHELTRSARQTEGIHTLSNWSYRRERIIAPGLVAVGDAAGFLDPVLSAGVFLATMTGYVAAVTLNTALHAPGDEQTAWNFFETWTSEAYGVHRSMCEYWYDVEGVEDDLFWHSRQLVDPAGHLTARRAFVRATAGYVGNLAAVGARGRIDAENFRHLGVRNPERFADADVAAAHADQDRINHASQLAVSVGGDASVRVTAPDGDGSEPVQYISRYRLFTIPAGLDVPSKGAADHVLFVVEAADGARGSFIELNRAPASAYKTLGQVAFGYRAKANDSERLGLTQLERLLSLIGREAPPSALESPAAAAAWLCANGAEAGLNVALWSVRG